MGFSLLHVLKLLSIRKLPKTIGNLDSLGKEVSGLGGVFGGGEGRGQLGNNISSGVDSLADKSEGTDHGKTAVLDLLNLLLRIFLRGVVDVEGVPSAGVTNTNVSGDTVGSLFLDADDAVVLDPCHTANDLVNGGLGHGGQGREGVELTVSINSAELVGSGEGSEKSRPEEADNGELGDTAVGKLGLTEPLNIAHEVTLNVKGVVEGGKGASGETDGVETNISGEGSIKGIGRGSEGKGLGSLNPVGVKGGGGLAGGGRGEGGGRASKGGEDSKLHGG